MTALALLLWLATAVAWWVAYDHQRQATADRWWAESVSTLQSRRTR